MHARNLRFVCTSPAPHLAKQLLTAASSGFLFGLLAGSVPEISSRSPCGIHDGGGALSREINQFFNQLKPGVLSNSCEPLLRGTISFENFPGLTNHPIFDLIATTLKRTLSTFGCPDIIGLLLVILNSDPSVLQILRSVRIGFKLS
jgi:hypothetical protein